MQQPHFDRQASAAQEASWFFERLFAGIVLDDGIRTRAQEVIARCVADLRLVRSPGPGTWDRWEEAMERYAVRDRELELLLTGNARDTLTRNAAAVRAHFDAVRA